MSAATAEAANEADAGQAGYYCSTSGTYFHTKESLLNHYRSDFHRYNLKRKVAGLPPVTQEWFDAHKHQLSSIASPARSPAARGTVWTDPLTRKKFKSEQTYKAFVASRSYQQLVKKTGAPVPQPVVTQASERKPPEPPTTVSPGTGQQASSQRKAVRSSKSGKSGDHYVVKVPNGVNFSVQESDQSSETALVNDDSDADDASTWETVSEEDEIEESMSPSAGPDGATEWDLKRSLFDNHFSSSFDENLEYMYKNFGFFLPDVEFLVDPQGLMKYLGAKLAEGGIPLSCSGMDPNSKRFRSLHAVQRHMVDTNHCKMLYEGNEEEYEDFYEYPQERNENEDTALMLNDDNEAQFATGGYELVVPSKGGGSSSKIIGARELAPYYKQHPKPADTRQSVVINSIIAQYQNLGIRTGVDPSIIATKPSTRSNKFAQRSDVNLSMKNNAINKLPRNVPY